MTAWPVWCRNESQPAAAAPVFQDFILERPFILIEQLEADVAFEDNQFPTCRLRSGNGTPEAIRIR